MDLTWQMKRAIAEDKKAQEYFKAFKGKCNATVRTSPLWDEDWSNATELKVHPAHHQGLAEWYARRTWHGD